MRPRFWQRIVSICAELKVSSEKWKQELFTGANMSSWIPDNSFFVAKAWFGNSSPGAENESVFELFLRRLLFSIKCLRDFDAFRVLCWAKKKNWRKQRSKMWEGRQAPCSFGNSDYRINYEAASIDASFTQSDIWHDAYSYQLQQISLPRPFPKAFGNCQRQTLLFCLK